MAEGLAPQLHHIAGVLLGDKGFIRPLLKEDLAKQGIDLHTPLRKNMRDDRSRPFRNWVTSTRRLVETVIGQLTERFQIENNRARDLWHLVSRLYRKVAAHTLCIVLNRQLDRPYSSSTGSSRSEKLYIAYIHKRHYDPEALMTVEDFVAAVPALEGLTARARGKCPAVS